MRSASVELYHFSGSGNTLTVAEEIARTLRERGIAVAGHRIERGFAGIEPGQCLGFAVTVAYFSTYPFIWKFLESLPPSPKDANGAGVEVFYAGTMAGFAGGAVGSIRRVLTDRGYSPVGAKVFLMPSNYHNATIDRATNERRIAKARAEAASFANDLADGRSSWGRIPVLSDMVAAISRNEWAVRSFRKRYRLFFDRSKCDNCGLCADLCPVGNISLDPDGTPRMGNSCEYCQRCVSFCPRHAIGIPGKQYMQYRAAPLEAIRSGALGPSGEESR
jgi:ferredoxin/flavodoxin